MGVTEDVRVGLAVRVAVGVDVELGVKVLVAVLVSVGLNREKGVENEQPNSRKKIMVRMNSTRDLFLVTP